MAEARMITKSSINKTIRRGANYLRGDIPDPENREKNDFYPTPPIATEKLLSVERFEGPIWECACGDGAISKVLEKHGHTVISTDLIDRGFGSSCVDFLMERQPRAPNIITNPPFKFAHQFVEKSLALTTGKVAMLLRLAWLEGKNRKFLFEASPLSKVWVFSERLPFFRNSNQKIASGGGLIAFAWFIWDHQYNGDPRLGWL
jgi:hypothetical protein